MPVVSESLDSSTTKRRLVFRFWNERGFSKHTHTFKKKTRARHGMAKFVYGRKDGQAWTGSGSCAHLVGLTDLEMCFIFVLFFPHFFLYTFSAIRNAWEVRVHFTDRISTPGPDTLHSHTKKN